MRKCKLLWCIMPLMLSAYLIAGCGNDGSSKAPAVDKSDKTQTTDSNDDETEDAVDAGQEESDFSFADIAGMNFTFASGAGAWDTSLVINADGTFSGNYHDSEMGQMDDEAPNGACYVSVFTGEFTEPKKVDDYTYSVHIKNITLDNEVGTEEVMDGIRYIYSEPYGLDEAEEILIYLPGSVVADLPTEYVDWLRGPLGDISTMSELPFYGIYNVKPQYGFFGEEVSTNAAVETEEAEVTVNIDDELAAIEVQDAELQERLQTSDMTQSDMTATSYEIYTLWDDELNLIWGRIKSRLDEDSMNKLLEEQRKWIANKEEAVADAGAEYEGGTIQPMIENDTAAELTKERVYELADYLR